jgi:hypothetical protein
MGWLRMMEVPAAEARLGMVLTRDSVVVCGASSPWSWPRGQMEIRAEGLEKAIKGG